MKTVKKDLMSANPKAQLFRRIRLGLVAAVICAAALFAGLKAYQKATYNPFTSDHVPAYQSDDEKIGQAVEYMREHFDTDLFDDIDGQATAGFLREVFIKSSSSRGDGMTHRLWTAMWSYMRQLNCMTRQ